jgi:hypothetical protein
MEHTEGERRRFRFLPSSCLCSAPRLLAGPVAASRSSERSLSRCTSTTVSQFDRVFEREVAVTLGHACWTVVHCVLTSATQIVPVSRDVIP